MLEAWKTANPGWNGQDIFQVSLELLLEERAGGRVARKHISVMSELVGTLLSAVAISLRRMTCSTAGDGEWQEQVDEEPESEGTLGKLYKPLMKPSATAPTPDPRTARPTSSSSDPSREWQRTVQQIAACKQSVAEQSQAVHEKELTLGKVQAEAIAARLARDDSQAHLNALLAGHVQRLQSSPYRDPECPYDQHETEWLDEQAEVDHQVWREVEQEYHDDDEFWRRNSERIHDLFHP